MYWADRGWTDGAWITNRIERANLDGSDVEALITHTQGLWRSIRDIALDVEGGKMYWTDSGTE